MSPKSRPKLEWIRTGGSLLGCDYKTMRSQASSECISFARFDISINACSSECAANRFRSAWCFSHCDSLSLGRVLCSVCVCPRLYDKGPSVLLFVFCLLSHSLPSRVKYFSSRRKVGNFKTTKNQHTVLVMSLSNKKVISLQGQNIEMNLISRQIIMRNQTANCIFENVFQH